MERTPPKIPALDAISFSAKESYTIEFSEYELTGGDSAERLVALTSKKMVETGMSFKEALMETQRENPEVTDRYVKDYLTVTTTYH